MKSSGVLVSALVAVSSVTGWIQSVGAQSAATDTTATEIRALEMQHNAAIAHADVAALDKMSSDDYSFITPRGFLVTKSQLLKAVGSGEFAYEYREVYELRVRVYGDAAVVTGRTLYTGQHHGKESSGAFRYTRMYVRQNGRWLAVAWQATREEPETTFE